MITLSQVNKTYGDDLVALNNINLQINAGEIFAIIGASGAGKSTLIRCLNGLELPDSGSIIINNQDLTQLSARALQQARHQIGMIFQHFNLLSQKTVYENVALPLQLAGKQAQAVKQRVNELLALVGISEKRDNYPANLSGGQKQRVAIARALANNPSVLLCDEATSALDPQSTQAILQLLKNINERLGITIVMITHEMDVVKNISDRVAVLDAGRIVECNDTVSLFLEPEQDITRTLIHHDIQEHLPEAIICRIHEESTPERNPLLCLTFIGEVTNKAIISSLTREHDIDLNILQGQIEYVKGQATGRIIIELLWKSPENLVPVIRSLEDNKINVEVLGYVERDVITAA